MVELAKSHVERASSGFSGHAEGHVMIGANSSGLLAHWARSDCRMTEQN